MIRALEAATDPLFPLRGWCWTDREGRHLPQRKPVSPWLIFALQVLGLVALGFVAARVGPKSLFDPAPTLQLQR